MTVVGAGHVGATTAHMLLQARLCDVVLVDVVEGLARGKALDMMHSRAVDGLGTRVTGTEDYEATADSDVVVVTAGVPRKPGMTREELVGINSEVVTAVMRRAVPLSPDAVYVVVTNPLDVMVALAIEVSGGPRERVFGMGGVLDSARFAHYISEESGAPIEEVSALVCGMHGEAMVPLPRHSTVGGRPLTEVLSPDRVDEVVRRTVQGGAEVVGLLKTGSAYYAPAASIAATVRAVLTDSREIRSSCVMLMGEHGVDGVCLSVPATLGREGVVALPPLGLDETESAALLASADAVREQMAAVPRF